MKFGQGIGRDIVEKIRRAKNRIWVVSPFISERYAKLLKSKYEEGVDVRVITVSNVDIECARRPREFVHAKIYIIDDSGFYGSMNLTDNGVNKNYEIMAHVKPEQLPEIERLFLKLWNNSLPLKMEDICDKAIFKKMWEYEESLGLFSNIKYFKDRFYVAYSDKLVCLSTDGKLLWRVPLTGSVKGLYSISGFDFIVEPYEDILLVYKKLSTKSNSKKANSVRVYIVRHDGIIISSFNYIGTEPISVYYDQDEKIIGILEKVDNRYKVVGLDINGNEIKDYKGRKDIIFFLPSVVRGDGIIDLEIQLGDDFRVSPQSEKIAVISYICRDKYSGQSTDTVLDIKVYDVNSKSLHRKSIINIGRSNLMDFNVDDDGVVYLLTEDTVYIVEDDIQKVTIVKDINKPMFESPKSSIIVYSTKYYYNRCKLRCQKLFLFNNDIFILLAEMFDYKCEYGNHYLYIPIHALIYSKNFKKLLQVLRCIDIYGWISRHGIFPNKVDTPSLYKFDDSLIICNPIRIKYFRKINLKPKVDEFLNFIQTVAPILKIDPENYRQTLSKLCEEGSEEIIHYIEKERQNLMQRLQTKKSEIEKELMDIVSQIEKVIQSGFNTKKVRDLLNFAKETLKNIVNTNLLVDIENKLEILKDILQKFDQTPTLSVDVETEEIKSKRLYKVILKLKTDSEFGVVAKIKSIKGNVESHFERKFVEVCPEATIEAFLVVQEEPPIPITVEIEYRHFKRKDIFDKSILIV